MNDASGVDVHGPIDFVVIEFTGNRLTGRTAQELVNLVERGIIWVYDLLIVGKAEDGSVYGLEVAPGSQDQVGGFADLSWARSGLLSEDDMREAAGAMRPGTVAALIVYENAWAIPFVAAAREAGGELIAGGRIPAQDVMAALESLELEATP
ncbi:MAG TPA: DUF6325 family protein [Pedococcus sp.]|jgi:hypothetical protein|uniref:DUF6325 family protein n=1 Tax=Pedococcus sp. TaxID=2860345 RepID=UPI002F933F59